MKAIGGYFELETNKGNEYHDSALRLNTGRNAFEYILTVKEYKKVYLPFYTCDVLMTSLDKLNLKYEFYSVDENLEPLFNKNLLSDEAFLYINYYGIKDDTVIRLSGIYSNIIIDNTQAFFNTPIPGIDTFYSARKFFGVADGAYLYTTKKLNIGLAKDISLDRMGHLLGRIDKGAEFGYNLFRENDESLNLQDIKEMSALSSAILRGIDYNEVLRIRKENFNFLNQGLKELNGFKLNTDHIACPMIYPFLVKDGVNIREILIKNQIYVASYWNSVLDIVSPDSYESYLTNNLLPLPIDQRYTFAEMQRIINVIRSFYGV